MNRAQVAIAIAVLAGACRTASPGTSDPTVRFDFETGDLQGWRAVEGGFGLLVCDRKMFHNRPAVAFNKQGRFFLSTLERRDRRANDSFVGVVESPVFVLGAAEMSLLVGGGGHAETYVALCTPDGQEHLHARGRNTETMFRVRWQAPRLVGRRVFLRVCDNRVGGWGHVTFDDFRAAGRIDPEATTRHFAERKRLLKAPPAGRPRRPAPQPRKLPPPGSPATLRAAIKDLIATFGRRYAKGRAYLAKLADVERRMGSADPNARQDAHAEFLALQREALVANPLVSGQPILFVVRPQYRSDHHNTATLFQTGEINTGSFRGGAALKAIDLGAGGKVRTLLDVPGGIARDPEVRFDGRRIVLSMRRDARDDYHLYEIGSDGGGLRRLTFGAGLSDFDPIYLPDGRVAFSSTREPKYCMCNRHIMGNLFRMDADGANVHQIGRSTLFEGHPALMPDGRILYDRWEYVDRNFGDAQGVWTCNPDGTNHAVFYGNNTASPGAILDARVIPGTGGDRFVATYSSCHDRPWGALAVVDRARGLDSHALGSGKRPGPEIRLWPAAAAGLVGRGNYDAFTRVWPKYEDPYPLAEPGSDRGGGRYFLCSRMTGRGEQMGLYLLDAFGNEILLHAEGAGCFDPMPLGPRGRAPTIPDRTDLARTEGYLYVHDVYVGTGMERVRRGTVRYLRVVESPEKRFWTHPNWQGSGTQAPGMAWDDFNNKRILGRVGVEADGSAYFALPADRFVYFQLLDANGMMVHSMRSGTIVRPGETTGCVGCHESRHSAVPQRDLLALRRPPRRLEPFYGAPRRFNYLAEVQPVFDRHCLKCHDHGKPAARKLLLAGDLGLIFNASYVQLRGKKLIRVPGAGPAQILPPLSWGSHASRLVQVLRKGHKNVRLSKEDFDRIVTWIDVNAPYYPIYASAYPRNRYGRSPLDDRQLARLSKLTGVNLRDQRNATQVSFGRPALSPCLARLEDRSDPRYGEALAIIEAGRRALAARPRAEMPRFRRDGIEARREAKYQAAARLEAAVRRAIVAGEKAYCPERGGGEAHGAGG